jgi:hypothetical protein
MNAITKKVQYQVLMEPGFEIVHNSFHQNLWFISQRLAASKTIGIFIKIIKDILTGIYFELVVLLLFSLGIFIW